MVIKCAKHEIILSKNMFKSRIIELADDRGGGDNLNVLLVTNGKRQGFKTKYKIGKERWKTSW